MASVLVAFGYVLSDCLLRGSQPPYPEALQRGPSDGELGVPANSHMSELGSGCPGSAKPSGDSSLDQQLHCNPQKTLNEHDQLSHSVCLIF